MLDVGPAFYAWARAEGLDAGPWFDEPPRAPEPVDTRILLPAEGDEYLVEAGVPAEAQAIPLRVRVPGSVRRLEARTDDGLVVPLSPPFVGRLPARPGTHRVEIWAPGGTSPLASARFVVHGRARP